MSTTAAEVTDATPQPGRVQRIALPAAVGVLAVGTLTYVGAVDPNEPGHYPTCPFLWVTGLFCPGCGALRTLHALAHLDVAAAVSLNVLVTAAVPVLLIWWARWAYRECRGRPRRWLAPAWSLWTLLGLVLTFWLLRNLPWFAVLAP